MEHRIIKIFHSVGDDQHVSFKIKNKRALLAYLFAVYSSNDNLFQSIHMLHWYPRYKTVKLELHATIWN